MEEEVIIDELDKYPVMMNEYDYNRIRKNHGYDEDIENLIDNAIFWKKKYAHLNKAIHVIAAGEIVNV